MGRLAIICLWGAGLPAAGAALDRFQYTQTEMAIPIKIVLYAPNPGTATSAARQAFAKFRRLNGIFSDYDPGSELRRLCRTSGEGHAVPVSDDLWHVLSHAQALAARSCGAFDVTVGPVVRLWRRARRREQLPSDENLEQARRLVGYRLLHLDPENRTARLLKPGMRLDLGGIAKGYAVDEAMKVLREHGLTRVLIDAGGDIGLGEAPPGKPGWLIGIARLEPDAPPSKYLWLKRTAIATSGDTWQYVQIDGKRYSHIVDPRTGLGLSDHSSVTVVALDCRTADSLASAVSVLGPKAGLKLIERTAGAEAFIVRAPHGKIETYQSSGWKRFSVRAE